MGVVLLAWVELRPFAVGDGVAGVPKLGTGSYRKPGMTAHSAVSLSAILSVFFLRKKTAETRMVDG